MIKTIKIPKLRFKGFSGEWRKVRLGEIMAQIHRKNTINNNLIVTISASNGLVPQTQFFTKTVASANLKNYILIQKDDFVYNKSYSKGFPFGVIKRLISYENAIISPLYITFKIKNTKKQLPSWWDYYFHSQKINRELYKITQEGARNHGLLNLYTRDFFDIPVLFPSLAEQRKIASFFSTLDDLIDNLKQQKQKLEEYKKGLMQKIFPQKGENVPKLRFEEFSGEWKEVRLGEVIEEFNLKNKKLQINSVYSVNNKIGFIPQKEQFQDRHVASKNLSRYKIVMPNYFAYNPARINVGSIALWKGKSPIIVSPMYIVFRTNETLLSIFLVELLKTHWVKWQIKNFSEGSVRRSLDINALKNLKIHLPSLPEQRKIAKLLSNLDKMIQLKQKQIEKLEEFKKGLMQRMFI